MKITKVEIVTLLGWSDFATQTYSKETLERWQEQDKFTLPVPAHSIGDKVYIILEEKTK